jgi:hypothetical protein
MELAAAAGLTAYRFSVEWARIEPADGAFSPAQVLHYLAMVRYARELGLEPVLTLHHFTSPAWFSAEGGWLRVDAVARFLAYVEAIEPVLAEAGRYVVTINEPNMVAVMAAVRAGQGALETGLGGGLPTPLQPTVDALTAVHRATRDYLHAHHPHLRVGVDRRQSGRAGAARRRGRGERLPRGDRGPVPAGLARGRLRGRAVLHPQPGRAVRGAPRPPRTLPRRSPAGSTTRLRWGRRCGTPPRWSATTSRCW